MIVAVDIGGSNTRWGTGRLSGDRFLLERHEEMPTAKVGDLATRLETFAGDETIEEVTIGIAGPIEGRRASTTNAGLAVDADRLSASLRCSKVNLLNDLEAQAYGVAAIDDDSRELLKPGKARAEGTRALVAAGAGLGESVIVYRDGKPIVLPAEAGHCDFSPSCAREDRLLSFLRARYPGHVSWERVLSGSFGFRNLYDFLLPDFPERERLADEAHLGPAVQTAAEKGNPLAREVAHLFLRLYGVEAGNLALRSLAYGGVYIGGGIAQRLRPFFTSSEFARGFSEKGRMSPVVAEIPVYLVTDKFLGLRGALAYSLARPRRETTA